MLLLSFIGDFVFHTLIIRGLFVIMLPPGSSDGITGVFTGDGWYHVISYKLYCLTLRPSKKADSKACIWVVSCIIGSNVYANEYILCSHDAPLSVILFFSVG